MATPISKTIEQLFSYSGGRSCSPIYNYLDAAYPGWTGDTVVDVLTFLEGARAVGQSGNVLHGISFFMSATQRKTYLAWASAQMLSLIPVGYPRLAALTALRADLVDYVTTPNAPKKIALLIKAKLIRPTATGPSADAEMYLANAFKGLTVDIANDSIDGTTVISFSEGLAMASYRIGVITKGAAQGAMLTKMEEIIGLI